MLPELLGSTLKSTKQGFINSMRYLILKFDILQRFAVIFKRQIVKFGASRISILFSYVLWLDEVLHTYYVKTL